MPTGQWDWAWTQVESALTEANQLAGFEWKEWSSYGVDAVNALAPLRQLGIEILRLSVKPSMLSTAPTIGSVRSCSISTPSWRPMT